MLKDERKAIERLIDENNFEIIKNYPSDGVFKENEFIKLSNEVYLNVIDSGNGERAELYKTNILCRHTAYRILLDSTSYSYMGSNYGPNSNGTHPVEFKYGMSTATADSYGFFSEGLQTGLQYVGNKGKVKLIVPFKRGASYDMTNGNPVYFEIIEYKFED